MSILIDEHLNTLFRFLNKQKCHRYNDEDKI
jgi:hypothetical protein